LKYEYDNYREKHVQEMITGEIHKRWAW